MYSIASCSMIDDNDDENDHDIDHDHHHHYHHGNCENAHDTDKLEVEDKVLFLQLL